MPDIGEKFRLELIQLPQPPVGVFQHGVMLHDFAVRFAQLREQARAFLLNAAAFERLRNEGEHRINQKRLANVGIHFFFDGVNGKVFVAVSRH